MNKCPRAGGAKMLILIAEHQIKRRSGILNPVNHPPAIPREPNRRRRTGIWKLHWMYTRTRQIEIANIEFRWRYHD